jgi:abequosyltransferase
VNAAASRPRLSVCIPAYNRARFLDELLVSIQSQGDELAHRVEILICEDHSPEREKIRAVVQAAQRRSALALRYVENEHNLGYDGNIRQLVALARGEHCFFMGNDDVLAPQALTTCLALLQSHPDVGVVLRGYAVFKAHTRNVTSTVRYVHSATRLEAGADALAMCYRRSGVISGYIVSRDAAHAAATSAFDGSLYYQMHLTSKVCAVMPALVIPDVLVLCRDEVTPDFGAAPSERAHFVPGAYTPQARVHMVRSALQILNAHAELHTAALRERVVRDYARHFYPFVVDQLHLPWRDYLHFCRAMAQLPVGRFPSFYVNCLLPYVLGRTCTDACIGWVRKTMGRTPRF